jgi:wobble nucleotide-excising tRNase
MLSNRKKRSREERKTFVQTIKEEEKDDDLEKHAKMRKMDETDEAPRPLSASRAVRRSEENRDNFKMLVASALRHIKSTMNDQRILEAEAPYLAELRNDPSVGPLTQQDHMITDQKTLREIITLILQGVRPDEILAAGNVAYVQNKVRLSFPY